MAGIADWVWAHAECPGAAVALRFPGVKVTYRGLRDEAVRQAEVLLAEGIGKGDRVVLLAPNGPQFVVAYLALQALGAAVVPVNPVSTSDELRI